MSNNVPHVLQICSSRYLFVDQLPNKSTDLKLIKANRKQEEAEIYDNLLRSLDPVSVELNPDDYPEGVYKGLSLAERRKKEINAVQFAFGDDDWD